MTSSSAAKNNSIDIKDALCALDKNDKDFYTTLTDEQKKSFSPWLLMRWSSSVDGVYLPHYLIMTNEIVNKNFSSLNKHPELQWKLLSLCGIGKKQYHVWQAPPKKFKGNPVKKVLSEIYPTYKTDELDVVVKTTSTAELIELMKQYGYSEEEIKTTFKN